MVKVAAVLAALILVGDACGQDEDAGYTPLRNPVNDYYEAIDRIEGEFGPYAPELSDLYLGLGQTLMERMEYEKALDAFNRSVMVVRVNSGPMSPRQTDHLYLIANIETLLGNDESADHVLHNIYTVNAEGYGEDSPELVPVIERMYRWYLTTRPPGSDRFGYDDCERIIGMREKILEISELHDGPRHPNTALAWRQLGEAHFQTIRYLLEQGVQYTLDSRLDLLTRTMNTADGGKVSIGDHYYAGRKAFKKYLAAIEADASLTPLDYAQAYTDLGDWYLAAERFRHARELYERAYEVLAQSDAFAELAGSYMAQPRPVYFFQPPPDFFEDTEVELPEMNLDISMTVTRRGDVLNAEVLNPPAELPEDTLGDILRLVRETPFRPAMKAGEVVTTRDFIWQFAILPPDKPS